MVPVPSRIHGRLQRGMRRNVRRWTYVAPVLIASSALSAAAPQERARPGERTQAVQSKSLALCLSGQLRTAPSDTWRLVSQRFRSFDVVAITTKEECKLFQQYIWLIFQEVGKDVVYEFCYDEELVQQAIRPTVDQFAAKGWALRNTTSRSTAQEVPQHEFEGWFAGRTPLNGSHSWLRQDEGYYFRSSLMQAYTRGLCAEWLRNQEAHGVTYEWVLFGRTDVDWQSFPEEHELESPHPLIWLHFRSVEMVAAHNTDRFHIGKRNIMMRFLEKQFDFIMGIQQQLAGAQIEERLLLATCLERPGEARFTCPPDFGPEDIMEFMCLVLGLPYRMHPKICFNLRSMRFEGSEGVQLENNCRALQTHEDRGFVTEFTKLAYSHPYSQDDDYDSLFAIKLNAFLNSEASRLGRAVSLLDVGTGLGTYVTLLQQFHPEVFGMDMRLDTQDILGETGILQDLTRPMPRPLRHCFDWVLTFNTAQHIPEEATVRFLVNLLYLPRVGIIAFIPPGLQRDRFLRSFDVRGWVRDRQLEADFLLESGLLCCREWFQWIAIFRRGILCESTSDTMKGDDVGAGVLCIEPVPLPELQTSCCGNVGIATADEDNGRGADAVEPVAGCTNEASDMDWLDFKVPAGNVVWGSCRDGGLMKDEHDITLLYLKFFRLCIVSEEQLHKDLETMNDEWHFFVSKLNDFFAACALGDLRSTLCNKFWGVFEMLERVSARLRCGPATPCEVEALDCSDIQRSHRLAVTLKDLLEAFVGWQVLTFAQTLSERSFGSINALAQVARCSYVGDWPPVLFKFEPGFAAVSDLHFSHTLWGKYMLRIHSVAGVRS